MKLKRLELRQFRNLSDISLDFTHHLNVFVGDNGQGKTNILESIVFLSQGKSFRVSDDTLLIQDGLPFSKIKAELLALDRIDTLEVVVSKDGKYFMKNNTALGKMSDFIGSCNVVLFNPDDLHFFSQAPRKRRREIDYELGKLSHQYLMKLSLVTKLIGERNAYLKQSKVDASLIDALDEQIVRDSEVIIQQRHAFVEILSEKTGSYFRTLVGSEDTISIEYMSPVDLSEGDYRSQLYLKMKENYKRDCDFRVTSHGIHRDDYVFKINDIPVTHVLSQGQRRLLMVAYKLAVIDCIYEKRRVYPILCLDDLFSELDAKRRKQVLSLLDENIQIFISTTDLSFVDTEKSKKVFFVKSGKIIKEGIVDGK